MYRQWVMDLDVKCHSVPAAEGFKELQQGQLHTYSFKTAFCVTVYRPMVSTHLLRLLCCMYQKCFIEMTSFTVHGFILYVTSFTGVTITTVVYLIVMKIQWAFFVIIKRSACLSHKMGVQSTFQYH